MGSTCSQLSAPPFLLVNKQLKTFSHLPVRHHRIFPQPFSADSVQRILLALMSHTHHKNGINLSCHISFIGNTNLLPSRLSYFTALSITTSFSHEEKASLISDIFKETSRIFYTSKCPLFIFFFKKKQNKNGPSILT